MSEPRGYITEDDIAEGAGFKRPEREGAGVMADTEDTETLAVAMCGDCREPHMGRGRHNAERWGPCEAHREAARWLPASSWLAARDERIRADEREKLAAEMRALHVNNDGPNDWCVACYGYKDEWPCATLALTEKVTEPTPTAPCPSTTFVQHWTHGPERDVWCDRENGHPGAHGATRGGVDLKW